MENKALAVAAFLIVGSLAFLTYMVHMDSVNKEKCLKAQIEIAEKLRDSKTSLVSIPTCR
jgi:hypothetical protein